MPIVLKLPNGSMRIMSGNTRADVATQLTGGYKALLIVVNNSNDVNVEATTRLKEIVYECVKEEYYSFLKEEIKHN